MRRVLLPWLLAAALFLSGCGSTTQNSGVLLYFCTGSQTHHGPAIQSQPYSGPAGPGVEELVAALLAGPTQEGLVSPFPQQYGGLADVSLTLADYCLVLTLSQIEGVDTVQIQSAGHTYHSRSHQTLKPGEAVLDQTLPEEVLRAAGAES